MFLTLTQTPPIDATDQPIFEEAKQPEDDNDVPYASNCGGSLIPPSDGEYATPIIAMDPVDKPSSSISTVTSPSHHSNQSMPSGDYVNHSNKL